MNELWIPILGVICAVGMPVLLGIIASYMTIKSKHEEKMAMIEKGIVLEEAMRPERRPNRYNTLRNGIFMIGLSLGEIIGLDFTPEDIHIMRLNETEEEFDARIEEYVEVEEHEDGLLNAI